jgi:hypothetical protein
MTNAEIMKVGAYLRATLDNPRIHIEAPRQPGRPIFVCVGDQFLGTVHRDEEDGEVSYHLQVAILAEDLVTV